MNKENNTNLTYSYGSNVAKLFGIFTLVAIIGWAVSTFLAGIHFWALPLPPDADPQGSIEVITSNWAYIAGIPLALLGAFYYLSVIIASSMWFQTRHPLILKLLTPVTASGVVFSTYFVYLQLVPIGAICPFCMMSAAATVILFILELIMLKQSDLPGTVELLEDWRSIFTPGVVIQLVILSVTALIVIGAFYGATLAPVPGN